ncbi:hypothetical protein Hanom_Chr12g01081881 [Helianthus anomalus]
MPKDRRSSSNKCRASPYSCYDKNDDRKEPKSPSLQVGYESEFEEARCPICMEHPHNAVLLLCSSLEKGCRPYMCDTNPRNSNCLDQFYIQNMNKVTERTKLACPLCRGEINGWAVVDPARQFMDSKARNCSLATCDFIGNYTQLEEHASRVHPCLTPTDVDPERELEWRRLEEDMGEQNMLNMQFEFDDDDDVDGDYVLSESELASDNLLDDSDSMFDFSSADE